MRQVLLAAALATVLALAAAACYGPPDRRDILANLSDFVFLPAFEDAAESAGELARAVEIYAADPTPGRLDSARERYAAARSGWTATAAFRFGPAMDRRSESQIDWWPIDPDGIAAAAAAGATIEDIRERQSAATRGFLALEFLLWNDDLGADRAVRTYASHLARSIADETAAIRDEWTGAGRDFAYANALAGRGGTAISATLALADVVRTSIFLAETVGDMQLGKVLGITGDLDSDAIPGLGPATGDDLRNIVDSIRASFLGNGDHLAVATLVNDRDDNAYDRMKAAVEAAVAAVDALPADIKADADDDALAAARDAIKQVQILYATEVVSLLGITVGFSDNDGDS